MEQAATYILYLLAALGWPVAWLVGWAQGYNRGLDDACRQLLDSCWSTRADNVRVLRALALRWNGRRVE